MLALALLAWAWLPASAGVAQASAGVAQATEAEAGPGLRVGRDDSGFAGVRRVGILAPLDQRYGVHVGLDYGLLESVVADDDLHHEVAARAALSMRPLSWVAFGVRFDGLYVRHAGGPDDGDSGALTRTRIAARFEGPLSERLRLGGELRLRVPAAQDVSDAFSGTSVDLRALTTYASEDGRLLVSGVLGVRLDQTRSAVPQPLGYTRSDRAVLGVTSGTALQAGLATTYRVGAFDVLGELTWDLYTGGAAPKALQTPIWVTGGVRHWSGDALHLDAIVSVSPSGRPTLQDDFSPIVIEPRFWVGLALGVQFGKPAPLPVAPQQVAEPPPPSMPGSITGQVRGPDQETIAGATITYKTAQGPQQAVTDDEGKFELPSVPPGPLELNIAADGYDPFTQIVQVEEGKVAASEVLLERPLPEGQIRGTVKDYKGRPVRAKIRIKPIDKRVRTDENGEFEVDVPPGDYTVVVTAKGFRSQTRPAKVHDNGVAVVIVDLRKK